LKTDKNGNTPAGNRFLLLIVLLLFSIGRTAAQSDEKARLFRIGAGLGYSFTEYREDTDLPINRNVHSVSFAIDSAIETGNFFHLINAGFFTGKSDGIATYPYSFVWDIPSDPDERHFAFYSKEDIFTRVYAQYALGYQVWGNKAFPGYVGGALRGDFYIIDTLNNPLYRKITGIFSLGVHAAQKWIVNANNAFVLTVEVPFFGYALRPSYIGTSYPIETGITSFHNHWAVFSELKYHYNINALISLNAGFDFEFSRIEFPHPGKDMIFNINLGIAFTFQEKK